MTLAVRLLRSRKCNETWWNMNFRFKTKQISLKSIQEMQSMVQKQICLMHFDASDYWTYTCSHIVQASCIGKFGPIKWTKNQVRILQMLLKVLQSTAVSTASAVERLDLIQGFGSLWVLILQPEGKCSVYPQRFCRLWTLEKFETWAESIYIICCTISLSICQAAVSALSWCLYDSLCAFPRVSWMQHRGPFGSKSALCPPQVIAHAWTILDLW